MPTGFNTLQYPGVTTKYVSAQLFVNSPNWSGIYVKLIKTEGPVIIACGTAGKIATSPNGILWTDRSTNLQATTWSTTSLDAAVWTGTAFVIGGASGKIATSPDGITWTYQAGLSSTAWSTTSVQCLTYGNGLVVACSTTKRIATSSDNGVTWTDIGVASASGTGMVAIAYGANKFVGIGSSSTFYSNSTANSWTYVDSSSVFGDSPADVIYDGNKFIAVSNSGRLSYSTNGYTWTPASGPYNNWGNWYMVKVAYGNNMHFAVGSQGGPVRAAVVDNLTTSRDLSSTVGNYFYQYGQLYSVGYKDGYFYIGGENGKIVRTNALTSEYVDVNNLLVRREYFNGGNVYGWGRKDSGELGSASATSLAPSIVAGGYLNWKQISSGNFNSGGIKTDGTLWTWGNGTSTITQESTSSTWKFIATGATWYGGNAAYAAIKTDNTLWVWGDNTNARLGTNNSSNYSSPVQIAGGGYWKTVIFGGTFTMGIKTDGTLWGWGTGNTNGEYATGDVSAYSSPVQVAGGGTWKSIGAGESGGAGIKTDGTIWSWGANGDGQIGISVVDGNKYSSPMSMTTVSTSTWKQVACGYRGSMAVGIDGTLWGVGENNLGNTHGQLGQGAANRYSVLTQISGGGTNWKQVFLGSGFGAGLKTDGTVWTWGANNVGQLGQGHTSNMSSPVQVSLPTTSIKALMNSNSIAFSAGGTQSVMLVSDLTT